MTASGDTCEDISPNDGDSELFLCVGGLKEIGEHFGLHYSRVSGIGLRVEKVNSNEWMAKGKTLPRAPWVEVVTTDAGTDEMRGSFYPAILTLSQKDMNIDSKRVPLSPGMNLTAEMLRRIANWR